MWMHVNIHLAECALWFILEQVLVHLPMTTRLQIFMNYTHSFLPKFGF